MKIPPRAEVRKTLDLSELFGKDARDEDEHENRPWSPRPVRVRVRVDVRRPANPRTTPEG